jgi:hypothetical protein
MKTIKLLALCAAAALTPEAFATRLDCSELKQRIESQVREHGVQKYAVEIVDAKAKASGKEVGRCEDGTRKLMYSKSEMASGAETSTPRKAEATPPLAEAATRKADASAHLASTASAKTVSGSSASAVTASSAKASSPSSASVPEKDDKVRRAKTRDLIDSLHRTPIAKLDYSWPAMPANIRELGRRAGDVAPLVRACRKKDNDAAFHFNVLAILNHKLNTNYESRPLDEAERKEVADCLLASLKHESTMVRAEAVWGLAFFHDPKHEFQVSTLLKDKDAHVAREARTTMDLIQKEKLKK